MICRREPFRLWIGCGNVESAADDVASDSTAGEIVWHCFVVAEPGLLQRWFGKRETTLAVSELAAAIERLLAAEPAIEFVDEP